MSEITQRFPDVDAGTVGQSVATRFVDVAREREDAQRCVIALDRALHRAVERLAQYGAPYEDLVDVLNSSAERAIDLEALLATDPQMHLRIWTYIHRQIAEGLA
jgi:hypothetical protein